ncbi:metal ABC transporter substrate-binding protein [Cohnella luojiensis]|uniref:Zinc ABC transporter substrate-binding protein n=1 Tax=Cohnella luojiensis TaxID=652876 RepID=A0A4Y8LXL1_9BACL|nr:metal ABC transporter substrate-binding protein [Cohnella luojiensis]TFE26918.1 zinc ABC transporter substrate-binding protein [Cohnella luojiensis]
MKLGKGMAGVAIAALVLSGCGNSNGNDAGKADKLKVVASFYPMVEFTKQVAGDRAEVVGLIPSGVEPHDWEPSPKDVAAIQEADLFVYNGLVEGWAEKTLESAKNDNRVDVRATDGIELIEGTDEHEEEEHEEEGHEEEGHEEEGHALDPHVWLSPALAQQEVRHIQAGLEKADPDNKEEYKKNADAYIEKLQALDEKFKNDLSGAKQKEFVTQHAAFGYLAKDYGLTQVPISGLSPEQEPSPEQMAEVVAFANEHEVKTIFFETLVDPKIAQTIADEIGAKTDVLNPLEGLTDEDISKGLDYIGIMENNLAGLVKALNE